MCGISGIISNEENQELALKKVKEMSSKITHEFPVDSLLKWLKLRIA